jgi:hypothetical protein
MRKPRIGEEMSRFRFCGLALEINFEQMEVFEPLCASARFYEIRWGRNTYLVKEKAMKVYLPFGAEW